jgi:hypothetical protein
MVNDALGSRLLAAACARAASADAEWLTAARRRKDSDLAAPFAAASRHMGRAPLSLSEAEAEFLGRAGLAWSTATWAVDDAARVGLLLCAADRLPASRLSVVVEDLHRLAGLRERAALMRALPLLPQPSLFCGLARAAARSEAAPLVAAIGCDNPYPGVYFPEEALRQLALRLEASGLPSSRVLGLERRRALALDALLASGASL